MIKYFPPIYYTDPSRSESEVKKQQSLIVKNVKKCSINRSIEQFGSCTIVIEEEYNVKSSLYSFEPYGTLWVMDPYRGANGVIDRYIIYNINEEVSYDKKTITIEALDILSTLNWVILIDKRDFSIANDGKGTYIKPAIHSLLNAQSDNPNWSEFYWKFSDDLGNLTFNWKYVTKLIFDTGTQMGTAFLDLTKQMLTELQLKITTIPIKYDGSTNYNKFTLEYANQHLNECSLMGGTIILDKFEVKPTYMIPINMLPLFKGYTLERSVSGHYNRIWYKRDDDKGMTYMQSDNDRRVYGLRETHINDTKDKVPKDLMRLIVPQSDQNIIWTDNGVRMKIDIVDGLMKTRDHSEKFIELYDILTFRNGNNQNINFIVVGIEKEDIINDPEKISITVMDCNNMNPYRDKFKPKHGGTIYSTDINETEITSFRSGSKIRINGLYYRNGELIPRNIKSKVQEIDLVRKSCLRLKVNGQWVNIKDVSLHQY